MRTESGAIPFGRVGASASSASSRFEEEDESPFVGLLLVEAV